MSSVQPSSERLEAASCDTPDPGASTVAGQGLGGVNLRVVNEAGVASYVALPGVSAVIGRSQDATVRLDNANISRRHTELTRDPFGRWWARDLGSRNGTFVNGRRVEETVLRRGDEVGVGPFRLKIDPEPGTLTLPQSEPDSRPVSVSHDSGTDISSLAQVTAAKIDTAHLAALSEFGGRLNLTSTCAGIRKAGCL